MTGKNGIDICNKNCKQRFAFLWKILLEKCENWTILILRARNKIVLMHDPYAVFSIWKSLWVLQKACIKVVACAIYTDLFFSCTYILLFCCKIKSSCAGLLKLCTYAYDHECNVHTSNITHTRKSVHSIDTSMLKLLDFTSLSIFFFALCLDDFIMYNFLWGP